MEYTRRLTKFYKNRTTGILCASVGTLRKTNFKHEGGLGRKKNAGYRRECLEMVREYGSHSESMGMESHRFHEPMFGRGW